MLTEEAAPTHALTADQREAVDHAAGPLIVLAGPGTGKTRVITHRVARTVERGAPPESVVALTFTVKAARELRERLRALIGPAAADRVNAHTFHGFGLKLIRRFTDMLGLPPSPRLIDSAQQRRLLRSLIREHDLFPELLPQGRETAVAASMSAIAALANSAVFPARALEFAAAWGARLQGQPPLLDDDGLAAEHARHARFAQAARLYRLFADACAARAWLTFDDLILWPIRLLREHPPAAAMVRDDYRRFVVDEFQDVNLAQVELLRALAPPRRGGAGPDLCVVGDDDQSIYEFRGADDRAFDRFRDLWKGARVVPLATNFRSQKPIVDAAAAVIARAEERFEPDKKIEARPGGPAPGAGVECVSVVHDDRSGEVIAAMVLADRAATGRPWSSYAVIARTHPDLDRIGAALRLEGVPVRLARPVGALDDAGVQDLLRWVELLASPPGDPAGDYAAQWLLTRPPFNLPPSRLLEWSRDHHAARSRARLQGQAAAPLAPWLVEHHGDDEACGETVRRFALLEADLRGLACRSTAESAVFEIVRRVDLAHAELLGGRERAARVGALADVIRFVRARLDALDPPADLAAFWSYYNDLSPDEKEFRPAGEERVDGDPEEDAAGDRPDALTLLTAHSAKGLEFDTVFVVRARPPFGFPKNRAPDDDELPEGLVERPGPPRSPRDRALAEERRLFYVACTRAERRLVVLAKAQKSRGKGTDFFSELTLDPPCCRFVAHRTGDEVLAEAARAGVRLGSAGPIDDAASGLASEDSAEVLRRARREARLAAAQALDTVDRPDAAPADVDAATNRLREAAQRTALAAHLEGHGELPPWSRDASASDPLRADAAALHSAWKAGKSAQTFAASLFRPLKGPLSLSFSWINDYQRCPRCFYLKRVLKVDEPDGPARTVGTAAHEALADFYRALRQAESDGRPGPTLDDLLRLGREHYLAALPLRSLADEEQQKQLLAQLALAHRRLHDPRAEVEQVEFTVNLPYRCGDTGTPADVHTFTAKFDRLDRLPPPARGHRIVDYKTGRARTALLEPRKDDLQLGIYAMALSHHQRGGDDPPDPLARASGVAEYWVLATGERGAIDLADVDYAAVKETIDAAVGGMLAGRFDPAEGCTGVCQTFARD